MKVSNYMSEFYNKNVDMISLIKSEENELENRLKPYIDNSFKDTFIKTATENGVSNYESLLGIIPNKSKEDLQFRRERVINRLTTSIPYTERFFTNRLNEILGKGNWSYKMEYNNYKITIKTLVPGKNWYSELLHFFDTIIPCNMNVVLDLFGVTWQVAHDHFTNWQQIQNKDMTWQELTDGEWLN